MPSLAQRNEQYTFGFWSKNRNDVSYNQLQKFWSDLSPKARQELLRIDKQTLFEQARKNMYCSRCNGLLLEGFLQIVMYGKSMQQEGSIGDFPCNGSGTLENQNDCGPVMSNDCPDEMLDPTVHSWGGLTTTRDGSLTLLDCYLYAKSLKGLQNVFDSACTRERERELLYPDACGGGGRGWISQGMLGYGRGHGGRETCALHTARLSCDTLVDFWSALGEETRQSLLRMKEDDFVERLMYRFDSKRFCRDCRRNVIREFKELKELKRMRRETRCTTWFCVADTAFQYKVSVDTVQADWQQTFADTVGTYHHFEWAIGTAEGKFDILEFENVGMNGSVQINGLDLRGLSACYITLRAFKLDGRCTEISVKAHALKGQQCVHCRLVVGDGYVSIRSGESIRRFFERAEETEEEEDEDLMDKDENDLDGECSRPQKHAKSPELAREFLLDAAMVIFKEQVEKAFREGTARQNAHSIFVCLALKLLEERVHVACKEIITLEKQMKLLEEEEKEKREEEERKERKRTKEREKKLRRKERLKSKERGNNKRNSESNDSLALHGVSKEEQSPNMNEKQNNGVSCKNSVKETGDVYLSSPGSPDNQDDQFSDGYTTPRAGNYSCESPDGEVLDLEHEKVAFTAEQSKSPHQRAKLWKEFQSYRCRYAENASFVGRFETRYRNDRFEVPSRCYNGSNRQLTATVPMSNSPDGIKRSEKFHCSSNRMGNKHGFHSCSCKQHNGYCAKVEPNFFATRVIREPKSLSKSGSALDTFMPDYRGNRYHQADNVREGKPKTKGHVDQSLSMRNSLNSKKVWEPMEPKKYPRSNSYSDVTLRSSTFNIEGIEPVCSADKSSDDMPPCEAKGHSDDIDHKDNNKKKSRDSIDSTEEDGQTEDHVQAKSRWHSTDPLMSNTSNSENYSPCLSVGDSHTGSSNSGSTESSSTSDSEDNSHQSEGQENSECSANGFAECHEKRMDTSQSTNIREVLGGMKFPGLPTDGVERKILGNPLMVRSQSPVDVASGASADSHPQAVFPPVVNQNIRFPVLQAPSTMAYYHQNPVAWPAPPAAGLMPFPYPNHYLYGGPIGYGLNGDSQFCMQYGCQLNPSAAPFLNSVPIPVFHPFAKPNGVNTEEVAQITETLVTHKSHHEADTGKIDRPCPVEVPRAKGTKSTDALKLHGNADDGFSLFHFDGPGTLSAGCKSNPVRSKDGTVEDFSLRFAADNVASDVACNKKDKESIVEEYNLFAASNGLRFSFF